MRLEDLECGQQARLDLEDEAERRRMMREASVAFAKAQERPQPLRPGPTSTYTSSPLARRRSPFCTSDGRYWASSEDARRAQLELDAAAERQASRIAAAADRSLAPSVDERAA
jgi:hypothetical protein